MPKGLRLFSFLMEASCLFPQHYELSTLYPQSKVLQSHFIECFTVVFQSCQHFQSYESIPTIRQITLSLNDADIIGFQSEFVSWSKLICKKSISLIGHRLKKKHRTIRVLEIRWSK